MYISALKQSRVQMNEHRLNNSNEKLFQSFADLRNVDEDTSSNSSSATAASDAAAIIEGSLVSGCQSGANDIFYVSPPKRKASNRVSEKTSCRLSLQTINQFTPISPSFVSKQLYVERCSSNQPIFGNCNTKPRYSDTRSQVLRSGSCDVKGNMNNNNQINSISTNFNNKPIQQVSTDVKQIRNKVQLLNDVSEEIFLLNCDSFGTKKGQSYPSLCSCNVGEQAKINPFVTRPLFEYSLERRRKAHTYSCEQNAQILMRLACERKFKQSQSLTANKFEKSYLFQEDNQSDTSYSSDVEQIPPIPPPPSTNRFIHQLKLQTNLVSSYCGNNGMGENLGKNVIFQNCKNKFSDAKSMIGGSRTSTPKSKNISHPDLKSISTLRASFSDIKGGKSDRRGQANTNCNNVLQKYPNEGGFLPSCSKSDPSLCFLKSGSKNMECNLNVLEPNQIFVYNRNVLDCNKFNTIGPSSYSDLQLSKHNQKQRCYCLSKSFSNLTEGYFNRKTTSENFRKEKVNGENIAKFILQTKSNGIDPSEGRDSTNDLSQGQISHPSYFQLYPSENMFIHKCSLLKTPSSSSLNGMNNVLKEETNPLYNHHANQFVTIKRAEQLYHGQNQQAFLSNQKPKSYRLYPSSTNMVPWKHRQCQSRCSSSSASNSFRFDAAKHWLAVSSILLIIGAASVAVPLALRVTASAPFEERLRVAEQLLDQVPLIDGHNDLPWNIRKFLHNKLNDFNFDEDLRTVMPWARSHWSHTDLKRLKKGRVSAQFWAAYVPCEAQHRDAVQLTLEQIDVIKRLTDRYSPQLTSCISSDDILTAHKNHQLCSLTGVEGGHSLGGSLAVLRTLYTIGVRYVTLTSTCHTPWADSSFADAPTLNVKHGGLTTFGKKIIREMNRLGMMVDLSHVSAGTMRDAIEVSEAPVIFSHSSAYELCNSSRNVQNDMLKSLAKNGGLVMVNFYSKFLSCSENSTVKDAVAHINHIRHTAGIDHVGLGAGYDGINFTPKGLEDVSSYPTLFAELLGVGWSIDDLSKLAGGNFLRVMKLVEKIRDEQKIAGIKPFEDHSNFRTDDPYNCTSS